MGEGVSSALSLIVELANASGKLFLIEEPENDLHPAALRALLDVLSEAVPSNQLIVSTHSDVVLRHLGAVDGAVVYRAALDEDQVIPTTTFTAIEEREERLLLLSELGYDPELPSAWIIFEESTAERVCRQVLIPTFAAALGGARTVSARGAGRVATLFEDLHRLVLFALLSDRYAKKAWVLVDGDDAGIKAVDKLRSSYRDWPGGHFVSLSRGNFEEYYPPRFREESARVVQVRNWQERQERKGALAEAVCEWAERDPDEARAELQVSAADVIARLKDIESMLARNRP